MKVKYISCMDFLFINVELMEYKNINKLLKAIEKGKMLKVVAEDGEIDYVKSDYIMYLGVSDEENNNKISKYKTRERNS